MRPLRFALSSLSVAIILALPIATRTGAQSPAEDLVVLEQQMRELASAGKLSEALPLARKLVEAVKTRFGSDSKEYADALLWASILANWAPSEADLSVALKIYENKLGSDDPNVASILLSLAQRHMMTMSPTTAGSGFVEAKPLIDRALSILEKKYGGDAVEYAEGLVILGRFCRESRNFVDAESQFLRAFSIYEKNLTANRKGAVTALYRLEELYRDSKRPDDVVRVWRRIVAITEAALGPDHIDTLSVIESLAWQLRSQCHDEEAAILESRTLPKILSKRVENMESRLQYFEKRGNNLTPLLIQIGEIYTRLGRSLDARRTYNRAVAELERFHSQAQVKLPIGKSLEYATVKAGIAEADRLEGRLAEAEIGYRDAIGIFDEFNRKGSLPRPIPMAWLDGLEIAYRAQERIAEADTVRERAERRRAELKKLSGCAK